MKKHHLNACMNSGAFTKLRQETICFVMSVRPSVRMKQLGSHWKNVNEIRYMSISFRTPVEDIQMLLKSDMSDGYFA